jgi:cephalosporin-C deacetylase
MSWFSQRSVFFIPLTILASAAGMRAAADPAANPPHFALSIVPDHADALYHTGDLVTFTIRLQKDGTPVDGVEVKWVLSKDGVPPVREGEATLRNGQAVVTGSLGRPGFLRCDATFESEEGKPAKAAAAAGIDPWLIRPSLPTPKDFGAFWEGKQKLLAEIPINARLKPVASSEKDVEAFDLRADSLGTPVSGYFARPAGAKPKSLPAILTLQGAGVHDSNLSGAVSWAKHGLLAVDLNAHGMPNGLPPQFYNDVQATVLKDYEHAGSQSRETSYFLGMYLRVLRAIDFLASQPEWDGRTLILYGAGEGGGQAIAGAGLDSRVTLVVAAVPAMCDYSGILAGRVDAWPKLAPNGPDGKPDAAVLEASRYFDSVNFVRRIKGDILFTVGFIDTICPPTSVYAAFNQFTNLKLVKQIVKCPAADDSIAPDTEQRMREAVFKHIAERRPSLSNLDREASFVPPYPPSKAITGVVFDDSTIRIFAEGSDMWPITWADDDNLYTDFGDGGGFGGTDSLGRVSFGVARVEGNRKDYRGINIAGGENAPYPSPWNGKGVGILALGNTLYLWHSGDASEITEFKFQDLWRSDDLGAHWHPVGVRFSKKGGDFAGEDEGFHNPVFCEFGRGNAGARDDYVYCYAPDIIDPSSWYVQVPGRISLFRVLRSKIESKADYEFFAGPGPDSEPLWTKVPSQRKPVWEDSVNGTHRMAVSYNPVLKRYLLTTVTINRRGWMSIYDAPEPWGPWTHVHTEFKPERWGTLTILFSFVNKWLSPDGRDFVMVYAKNDHWASIEGHFQVPGK